MSADVPAELTVREIGEFALIEQLRAALPPETIASHRLTTGIGDDAAIWRPTPGESLVITTDSLVEAVHFRLDWTDWSSLGHKTLAVNLSDLAAMGATPTLATLTLGLRGDERVSDLVAFYEGVGALASRTGVVIAGGDIVASPAMRTFHVTALGETRGGRALPRSGARLGDTIAVSGTLGASAAGLRLLSEPAESPRRAAATASMLIAAHLRPEPRLSLGALLLERGATSAMDLSDGLFGDLPKMLAASGVGARLRADTIPVAAAVRALFPEDWLQLATRGGEDYELLFTVPAAVFAVVQEAAARLGSSVTAIGEIVPMEGREASLTMLGLDGVERPVVTGAFDHFG
jgi:thiamine-monophosphate kinase